MRPEASEFAEIERIQLEKLKFACMGVVSREMLADSRFFLSDDFISNQVRWMFEAKLLGKEEWKQTSQYSERVEDFPLSWWDHLKQTMKARWPRLFGRLRVSIREIDVRINRTDTIYRVCPHLHVQSEHDRIHFEWLKGLDA